ncbi:MAG: hypothetical protein ACAI44_10530 [Candidatus Sericytochromatia bacterium]
MGDLSVKQAQAAKPVDQQLKESGKEALSTVKTIRNVAAGVAVAGVAAMGAEALGVVTLPAAIPTAAVTLVAGGVAGVFGLIGYIGDGVDKLISSAQDQQNKQMPGQ